MIIPWRCGNGWVGVFTVVIGFILWHFFQYLKVWAIASLHSKGTYNKQADKNIRVTLFY